MAQFAWNDAELSVGNAMMDRDHRQMVKLANDVFFAMQQHESKAALLASLDKLIAFTQEHFKREEEIMQRIQYLELESHKLQHDKLSREVLELHARFNSGKAMLSIEVSKFLNVWVFRHILHDDMELAVAIRDAGYDEDI